MSSATLCLDLDKSIPFGNAERMKNNLTGLGFRDKKITDFADSPFLIPS
jgi:hypothetical protein